MERFHAIAIAGRRLTSANGARPTRGEDNVRFGRVIAAVPDKVLSLGDGREEFLIICATIRVASTLANYRRPHPNSREDLQLNVSLANQIEFLTSKLCVAGATVQLRDYLFRVVPHLFGREYVFIFIRRVVIRTPRRAMNGRDHATNF